MGSARITLCAGVMAAVASAPVVASAPAAYAQDGGISVSPASPAPGSDVALRMSGCGEKTATAVSAAFVTDVELAVVDGVLIGESRVRSTLTAGTYDVKVSCGAKAHKIPLTVVDGRTRPTAPASPVAPVHAGGGGTAHLAVVDNAREAGPGTVHAVIGLLLAGVAGVAVALRGSRRSRRTG
ncbi:hypothetical protein [Streptomyces cellulosae]|uniref:hypothetical protein n=1 Tax=Streptomyces cellulosae TaxID=1968 RepID=UPI0004C84A95|nr:hypothetical protein [Streptomyces cellulosae]